MGRPMRGSRLASFYTSGSDTDSTTPPSLSTLDSAFQLQEYIGALVRLNPHDVERIVKLPGRTAGDDKERLKDGEGEDERGSVDEACWIYEQLRRLAQDLTHPLITTLQQECTRQSCPEMKAGEWLYLCVAHGNSGAMEHCCAIDYIVHTLDSATALLNSPRAFPSRISIPPTSHRHFPSLARRLGRIFAHAYYHHRLAFESAEAESALYARFLALSRRFDLVPAEFLVIPAASGSGSRNESDESKIFSRDPVPTSTYTSPPAPDSTSATVVPANSPSPRIGGRARTDTMYLPGGYVSPHGTGSPAHGVSPKISPKPRLEELWGGDARRRRKKKEMSRPVKRTFLSPPPNPGRMSNTMHQRQKDPPNEGSLGSSARVISHWRNCLWERLRLKLNIAVNRQQMLKMSRRLTRKAPPTHQNPLSRLVSHPHPHPRNQTHRYTRSHPQYLPHSPAQLLRSTRLSRLTPSCPRDLRSPC
ncbi:Mob1/phocein [Ramaria rubella]|nr:Mob1/phocein [Ramaria rubella]